MPFRIVRNDITKMTTDAIVNTANEHITVGSGCDSSVYKAAGYEKLLEYRVNKVGDVPEGEAFITPGFDLPAKFIIHVVSPLYYDGKCGEEEKLRSCYRKSLDLAKKEKIKSIAFPLISTGSFGYPKEEGMRIAVDEINHFLLDNEMLVYLVVFDTKSTVLGSKLYQDLESYIDYNYVKEKSLEEYDELVCAEPEINTEDSAYRVSREEAYRVSSSIRSKSTETLKNSFGLRAMEAPAILPSCAYEKKSANQEDYYYEDSSQEEFEEAHEDKLNERMKHLSDTFSQYLMYLIKNKNMENADVYKRAIVDKKTFSKIKNNADYHPQKITALCLCIGAKLNLDETKDLLARAGYALSPCEKQDIIFSYFIENEIYDMIELDIQLEEHGIPCIIN